MSRYEERIHALAAEARRTRETTDPPVDPPDPSQALDHLRDGLAPVVSLYIEARTGDYVAFSETEWTLLTRALNDWLALYARCYGRDVDPDVSVREAAELVVDTHHLRETAQLLTHVPERHSATNS